MVWCVLLHLVGFVVDRGVGARRTEDAKDLAIALLRHQLRLLLRRSPCPPRLSRWEQLTVAVLAAQLGRVVAGARGHLARAVPLVRPETVLQWHRELVRRKWTHRRRGAGGRPPPAAEVAALLLRLAAEHPRWGDARLPGALAKRGHARGRRASTWRQFLAQHRAAVLACDCFTDETLFMTTLHGLFFLEIGTRRVHLAGCTAHPTAAWVTQQARQLAWTLQEADAAPRYLIPDRDAKFGTDDLLVISLQTVLKVGANDGKTTAAGAANAVLRPFRAYLPYSRIRFTKRSSVPEIPARL